MNQLVFDDTKTYVENAVDEAFRLAKESSFSNFTVMLALGDYCDILEDTNYGPYVVQNYDDNRYDYDRRAYLIHYLQKNYNEAGFFYQGENGIDDLTTELMIYSQLWESDFFVKLLIRLAHLSIGNDYMWDVPTDETKWKLIHNMVINPLNDNGVSLGNVVSDCFESNLRNSFAHSLYYINKEKQLINYHMLKGASEKKHRLMYPHKFCSISFKDYQKKFIESAHLSYYLFHVFKEYRDAILNHTGLLATFNLPNKKSAGIKIINDTYENRFEMVLLNNVSSKSQL